MNTNNLFLENRGGLDQNSLLHILDSYSNSAKNENFNNEILNEFNDDIQPSYYTDLKDINLVLKNRNEHFNIISLNCQSLNAKVDQLTTMIESINNKENQLDAICLQETWLTNTTDTSIYNLKGYNLICQGKSASKHGGLAIYLKNEYC